MRLSDQVLRIRPMSEADIARVMEIAAGLKHAPHWPVSSYVAALDPAHEPRRIALVADAHDAGGVIGFVVANVIAPQGELETIAVAGRAQRQSVGTKLLEALIQELRKWRVEELVLEVRASNLGAIGFYGREAFDEVGRRPRYYADPEEDAVLMRKTLD